MKTEDQIKRGMKELREQMKNPALPDLAKVKIRESIAILEWVLEK